MSYYEGTDVHELTAIGLNDLQKTTALMVEEAALSSSVWNIVDELGSAALLAPAYISQPELLVSPGLPDTQWQIEAANWFSIGLAQLQSLIITNYRKPSLPIFQKPWRQFPQNATAAQAFCGSQMVRDPRYATLNVFWLTLTIVIGSLIMLAGYGGPSLVLEMQKRYGEKTQEGSIACDQWKIDHYLQLQRMTLQSQSLATWEHEEEFVPITKKGQEFTAPRRTPQQATSMDVPLLQFHQDATDHAEDGATVDTTISIALTDIPTPEIATPSTEVSEPIVDLEQPGHIYFRR